MSEATPSSVAYLGPEGTYSHAAALKYFGAGQVFEPFSEIPDIFTSVEAGQCRYGLVPVENSSEGSVTRTLDCLSESDLLICGEVTLRIHHCLLVGQNTDPGGIGRIVSHQQSLGQCRQWLKRHYPGIELMTVSSNAEAARLAAHRPGVAAIAGAAAAQLYGLKVAVENIEDTPDNTTRFAVLSRDERPAPSGRDKTSIMVAARHEPGALFRALEPFHRHGVNLTKLESRPARTEAWAYSFFIDFAGHAQDPAVAAALRDLQGLTMSVKFLGSYPAAR